MQLKVARAARVKFKQCIARECLNSVDSTSIFSDRTLAVPGTRVAPLQPFNCRKDFPGGALNIFGKINFRPGQTGDIFVSEASRLDEFSEYLIIR